MGNLFKSVSGILATLFVVTCTATVTVQLVGIGLLSSRGMLTHEKLVRYAGVLYGLDPLDMSPEKETAPQKRTEETKRDEKLAERVRKMTEIADRQMAMAKGGDDIRGVVMGLKIKRDDQDDGRKKFEAYLQQLESEIMATASREIQTTLEALPAKQAKEIIRNMITNPANEPGDDAMGDLVSVIKSMPAAKTRKIFDEMKTDEERELLHRILVEIGKLDEPTTQLTGKPP